MLRNIARMITCKEVTRLSSERLDRPLSVRERFLTRIHMMYCDGSRRVAQQFVFLRRAMTTYRAGPPAGEAPVDEKAPHK